MKRKFVELIQQVAFGFIILGNIHKVKFVNENANANTENYRDFSK